MRFCTHCGSPAEHGTKFCTTCGTATEPERPLTPDRQQPVDVQPPVKPKSGLLAPLLVLGAAVLALAVVGTALLLSRGATDSEDAVPGPSGVSATSAAPPTPTSSSPPSTSAAATSASTYPSTIPTTTAASTSSPAPTDGDGLAALTPSSDAEALNILNRVRVADSPRTPDDSWVAQVASQYKGVEDRSIQPGPMSMSDVLRHHRQLRQDPRFAGSTVILVKADDFGKRKKREHEIWVTLVLLNKSSGESVKTWCANTFPNLTGDALRNACYERQYSRPSG